VGNDSAVVARNLIYLACKLILQLSYKEILWVQYKLNSVDSM